MTIIADCLSASSSAQLPADTDILGPMIDNDSSGEPTFHYHSSWLNFLLLRSKKVTYFFNKYLLTICIHIFASESLPRQTFLLVLNAIKQTHLLTYTLWRKGSMNHLLLSPIMAMPPYNVYPIVVML